MTDQNIQPSFKLTNFSCPHCDQLSEQTWFNAYANRINNPEGGPLRIAGADLERLSQNPQFSADVREQKVAYWNRVNAGDVFLDRWAPCHTDVFIAGMELSVCHACMSLAIWLGGKMVYPRQDGAGDERVT